MQIQTNLGYTLSASEFLPLVPKVVATQQLFQRQDSDAPFFCEISGLDGKAERQATHRTCAYPLGHPDVFVMESTEKGDGRERSSHLHGTAKRAVLSERKMGAGAIVIVGVGSGDPAQMGLAQD